MWEMKFNPAKCIHLAITNKKTYIKNSYQIYDQNIKQVSSTKYLGITIDQHLTWADHINKICNTIDQHLTWADHINKICNKANVAKAFLKRNIYQCPMSIKANCYKTLVRPILEYAAAVWSPHLQHHIHQLEKAQRSAACTFCNE